MEAVSGDVSNYLVVAFLFATPIFFCRRHTCELPETGYLAPWLRGILAFTAGWLVYLSFSTRDRLWALATRHADLVGLILVGTLAAGIAELLDIDLVVLGFPLLVLSASSGTSRAAKALSWRPVHYLGEISYSIYLIHLPWAVAWSWLYGIDDHAAVLGGVPQRATPVMVAVLIGGMIAASALSYHMFEKPLRRIIRAAWDNSAGPTTTATKPRVRRTGAAFAAAFAVFAVAGAVKSGVFRPIPLANVKPGDDILHYPTFEEAAWRGWNQRQQSSDVWSFGPKSVLVVRMPSRADASSHLALCIGGSFFQGEHEDPLIVRIGVNDVELGQFQPTPADTAIETCLPFKPGAQPGADGLLRIQLSFEPVLSRSTMEWYRQSRVFGMWVSPLRPGLDLRSLKFVAD